VLLVRGQRLEALYGADGLCVERDVRRARLLPNLHEAVEPLHRHAHQLGVRQAEHAAQVRDAPAAHQEPDLGGGGMLR